MNGNGEAPRINHTLLVCKCCNWGGPEGELLSSSDGWEELAYCPSCREDDFEYYNYWRYSED